MPGPGDLFDMATELLAASVDAMNSIPAGAPDRAFVSIGPPPFDCCPFLSVHNASTDKDLWSPNQASGDRLHRLRGGSVNLTIFVVTIVRCLAPVLADAELPTPEQLTADAEISYTDGWALYQFIQARLRGDPPEAELWAGFPCREKWISPLQPIAPQGGCAGYQLLLTAQIGGYPA